MHALTDTGDPESDLPISQKAVQSIGLRGKRAEKTQGLFSLCKMKTGERWI